MISFEQGDIVTVKGIAYTGRFTVTEPTNIIFDEETNKAKLVAVISPMKPDEFFDAMKAPEELRVDAGIVVEYSDLEVADI